MYEDEMSLDQMSGRIFIFQAKNIFRKREESNLQNSSSQESDILTKYKRFIAPPEQKICR